MKRKVIIFLVICCMLLAACSNNTGNIATTKNTETNSSNNVNNMDNTSEVVNDKVFEDVVIDGEYKFVLPEGWMDRAKIIRVQAGKFDENDFSKTVFDNYATETGESLEYIYSAGYYSSSRWKNINLCGYYFMSSINEIANGLFDNHQEDVAFSSQDNIIDSATSFITSDIGIKNIKLIKCLSETAETLKDNYEELLENDDVLGKKQSNEHPSPEEMDFKDYYYVLFTQRINELPVLCKYVYRKDDAYIPKGTIELGYTEDGLEMLKIESKFVIQGEKDCKLCDLDTVSQSIKERFEFSQDVAPEIKKVELVYMPMPVDVNDYIYDLVPVWDVEYEIRRSEDDIYKFSFYIDAITGKEMVFK